MKQIALALVVASSVAVSGHAAATGSHNDDWTNPFDHATRTELKAEATTRANADKDLQKQIDQKGYDINTQAKRIDGVNADLQASKAAGAAAYTELKGAIGGVNDDLQSSKAQAASAIGAVDSKANAINKDLQDSKAAGVAIAGQLNDKIDQTRADGAAAIGKVSEAVKSVDGKANAINDDLQASKAVGAAAIAEQTKINASQAATNGHVQQQISDVNGKAVNAQNTADVAVGLGQKGINDAYNAQQSANHAEGTAQKAGNDAYNAQQTANYAVGQGQKNGNDIVNLQNTTKAQGTQINTNTTNIAKNTTSINNLNTVTSQHTTQINNLDGRVTTNTTNITKNTNDIKATNVVVNQHTQQIATINDVNTAQQVQINNNTNVNARQDATLGQHATAINNLDGRTTALEDYSRDMDVRLGGRLDSQQSQINKNARDVKEAKNMAAGALAVAGQQFCTGQECGFQTAISASTIGGSQALAVGMGGAVSENVFLNAAFTKAGSVSGGVVSGTYRFK